MLNEVNRAKWHPLRACDSVLDPVDANFCCFSSISKLLCTWLLIIVEKKRICGPIPWTQTLSTLQQTHFTSAEVCSECTFDSMINDWYQNEILTPYCVIYHFEALNTFTLSSMLTHILVLLYSCCFTLQLINYTVQKYFQHLQPFCLFQLVSRLVSCSDCCTKYRYCLQYILKVFFFFVVFTPCIIYKLYFDFWL